MKFDAKQEVALDCAGLGAAGVLLQALRFLTMAQDDYKYKGFHDMKFEASVAIGVHGLLFLPR